MAMSTEDLKAAILDKALKSPKAQLYIKDFYACDPDSSPRAIKNAANEMVREGKLTFWSSGSTTMYAAKGRAKNEEGDQGVN
ncbi:MAG TPA: sulfite reductase [Desulfobulbaceae bacterium]|nr:sulfite reductase [Desulfobulbaceae bacterium]